MGRRVVFHLSVLIVLAALASSATARADRKGAPEITIHIGNALDERPLEGAFSAAPADTYFLAWYDFDGVGGARRRDGWASISPGSRARCSTLTTTG